MSDEWIRLCEAAVAYCWHGRWCFYCGTTDGVTDVDHVFPRSRGGGDGPGNKVVACYTCNRSKNDKTPQEWAQGQTFAGQREPLKSRLRLASAVLDGAPRAGIEPAILQAFDDEVRAWLSHVQKQGRRGR